MEGQHIFEHAQLEITLLHELQVQRWWKKRQEGGEFSMLVRF